MLLALLATLNAQAAAPRAEVLRHAVVVGENSGPSSLGTLRYAEADARRMAEVLIELGGFSADQVTVLYGPDVAELNEALADHAATARASEQDLFFFYYSGHADARGLRLGDETLAYASLRHLVRDVPAELRVGVLDACRSGEITRLKGLEVSSPFATDKGLNTQGEAWLTAATAEESAQESDLLKSSFFTHYLVNGLRGAADQGDGQVSLDEAYAYAYDRTVARTGTTSGGTQHPAYDFRLQGKGDLPLTDVRRAEARLILPAEMAGDLAILTSANEVPFAEINKAAGSPLEIGLPAGRYLLRLRGEGQVAEARIGLTVGSSLNVRGLVVQPLSVATAKGEEPVAEQLPAERASALTRIQQSVVHGLDAVSAPLLVPLAEQLSRLGNRGVSPEDSPSVVALPAVLEGEVGVPEVGRDPVDPRPLLSGLPDGPAQIRYANGKVAAEGEVEQGQPSGRWTFWFASGERRAEGVYRRGQRAGTWTWWFADGNRQRRGSFNADQRAGLWTEWYPGGNRRVQISYEAGSPNGHFIAWYPAGNKQREGRLKAAEPDGPWLFWHDNSQLAAHGDYLVGKPQGRWTTWHRNGVHASQGHYEAGLAEGRWVRWWENGETATVGHYAAGQRTGTWKSWNEQGKRVDR